MLTGWQFEVAEAKPEDTGLSSALAIPRPGGVRRATTATGLTALTAAANAHAMDRASPTHVAPQRPAYSHMRKESETLRSLPHGGSSSSLDGPLARDHVTGAGTVAGQTPTARSHRRAPTPSETLGHGTNGYPAPPGLEDAGAGRAWDATSASASGAERPRMRAQHTGHEYGAPAPPASAVPVQQVPQLQAAPQAPRTITVNKRMYHRLDLVGKGGSSRVYRVMSEKSEVLAIKRVALDKADDETIQGYQNEISLLKRLEGNSRIIRLVDSETKFASGSKGTLLIVMECGEIGRWLRLPRKLSSEP
jgi:serine/threonine-protein kinase TTK/MPS1